MCIYLQIDGVVLAWLKLMNCFMLNVVLFFTLQVVFRTVGYSGADIRNLVNEAGIMSVSSLCFYP